jgi:FixJ family two-component response regulator
MEDFCCVVGLSPDLNSAAQSWNASKAAVGQGVPGVVDSARHGFAMTDTRSLISVIDDDESVRESLPDLLRELGFEASAFSSAEDYLKSDILSRAECLILDIAMPGMNGLELQRELKRRQIATPIIFITAHQDEAMRRNTVAQGAVECLLKPFTDTALLNALNRALRLK